MLYQKLIDRFGTERAKMYLEANQAALAEYRSICRKIDCGFEEKDAFTYSLNDRKKIEKELAALERLGFEAELAEAFHFRLKRAGAVQV